MQLTQGKILIGSWIWDRVVKWSRKNMVPSAMPT